MDFATPSSRFRRDNPTSTQLPDFYRPQAPQLGSIQPADSGSTLPFSNSQPQYVKPAPADTRPGSTPAPGAESYALPIMQGMQNSSTPATTDTASNIISVAGNTLAGGASGALTGATIRAAGGLIGAAGGALIGGGVALVTSGLNAWLGNRQAKSEQDRQAAILADANRIKQQEIARDEKWRVQNRLDTLEQARYQRRIDAQNQARKSMEDTANRLQGALSTNASLRDHWAKFGFN